MHDQAVRAHRESDADTGHDDGEDYGQMFLLRGELLRGNRACGERLIKVAQTKRLMRGMRAIVCGHVMEARVIEESKRCGAVITDSKKDAKHGRTGLHQVCFGLYRA